MSGMSRDELERHLERLPKEAWERPTPPPPPWPAEEPKPAPRRRLSLRPAAAALASIVLLALGIGAGLLLAGGDDEEAGGGGLERVELAPVVSAAENAGGTAELRPEAGGRAKIELSGLRPSGPRDFYELWLLGDDGQLVSLGAVRVPASGDATLDVELPVDPKEFRYLDLSREPDDGDPGHSTISILRGPVT
jgi:anti-sigma-K factor RskA